MHVRSLTLLNSRFLSPAAITISFVALLVFSWRRWASAIADSGREMDLPLRLLEGDALYRDVFYMYPPLSPYFNSLLYSIFGARLEVLQVSGVLFSVLALVLSHRIARRFLERYRCGARCNSHSAVVRLQAHRKPHFTLFVFRAPWHGPFACDTPVLPALFGEAAPSRTVRGGRLCRACGDVKTGVRNCVSDYWSGDDHMAHAERRATK